MRAVVGTSCDWSSGEGGVLWKGRRIEILESDLLRVEDFPLAWRWTDAGWAELPSQDLERIRPPSTWEECRHSIRYGSS